MTPMLSVEVIGQELVLDECPVVCLSGTCDRVSKSWIKNEHNLYNVTATNLLCIRIFLIERYIIKESGHEIIKMVIRSYRCKKISKISTKASSVRKDLVLW